MSTTETQPLRELFDAFLEAERQLDFTTGEGWFRYDSARDRLIEVLLGEGDFEGQRVVGTLLEKIELLAELSRSLQDQEAR